MPLIGSTDVADVITTGVLVSAGVIGNDGGGVSGGHDAPITARHYVTSADGPSLLYFI